MASYGQYSRNQVASEEAADALEQSIFDSDHLFQKYREELSPLLQEAELRLDEGGLKKFSKIENILKTHVSRWYSLNKNLCEMALNFRTHYNHINVKLDSLKVEIEERDKIIRTQRKDFENEKQDYENQLKVLESALADSIPRNKSSLLSKYDMDESDESYQLTQSKKDLKMQQQQYSKVKVENKRLTQNIKILKANSNDFQQTLMNLNNEIAKKEDEILKLRWLTQDLAAERNGLELKVQQHSKDPNFTSVTPQRQMEYGVDLSKYLDDDAEDLSDDAAENGLLSLEMSDDADINPQVAAKLAEALEAVKKVTQFANDRDNDARKLESDKLPNDDHPRPNIPKPPHYNHPKPAASSKPSVNELYSNFEQMKRLQDSSPSDAHTLLSQMGGFNGLTTYIATNDDHYSSMLRRIESHIGHGTACIDSITKCISHFTDDEKHTATLNKSHSTLVTTLRTNSDSLISILNHIITELHSASDYIHSDHKKVELLHHQMKELELTMPYMESTQLAILNTLPSFLKLELNKIKRSNRIRTKQEEHEMDIEEEKQRQLNFDNSLSRVEMLNISIKEKTDIIKNGLRSNLEQSQTDPKAFAQYLQQIDIACDQISEYTLTLDDEFHFTREYIHPSQAALIAVVNQYNNLQIECEQLQKMLSVKQGEINAYEEMKNSRRTPPGLKVKDATQSQPQPHIQARDESFQFDDIETDFMNFEKYAAQSQVDDAKQAQDRLDSDGNGDALIPKINDILSQFKYKAGVVQAKIKNNYELSNDFNLMMELIDELRTHLMRAKQVMGPDSKYIARLEKRYIQIMGLYQMKYAEVEHKSDLLYQSDQYINDLKEDISDLDYRLGAVMSSAVSNVETRMAAFNEMGIKIQTFQKVLKLIDDTYSNIQQACQDIQESVEKDLYDIIGESFNEKQQQDTMGMLGNVAHACDYILKAFDDIGQEMDGVAQFVHPDREMCEQLQLELIAMYENQEKQQQQQELQVNGAAVVEDQKESQDIVTNLPPSTHPKIKPGDSADDIHIGSRRKSLLAFQQAFEKGKKRQSIKNLENGLDKLKKEDLRRSKNSRRRRSSVSNLPPLGLLPPVADGPDPLSRSDLGGYTMKDPMNEEDVTYLKSLAKDLKNIHVGRLKETPANSPLNSPKEMGLAASPRSEDDDTFALNIDDAVDDDDVHGGISIQLNPRDRDNSNRSRDRANIVDRDKERESDSNEKYISSLQKQIADKQSLIGDLQTNLRELSENRRRELLHFQQQLESMKQRCRDWYEQLMSRVGEMEGAYREKMNQEMVLKERQLEEERRHIREEERELQRREREVAMDSHSNPHEIDELSREIARLNEELEKFKGKYFDGEQSKIELADQLDEIKEEKFKMEEKLEELAGEVVKLENIIRNNVSSNNNESSKSSKEWNDLVQKLREEKEQQEAQYEEEFREFERMANEKVVQLEEYYVQQLQMKEVHNQQLQQQLHNTQQQMLLLNNTQQQQQQLHNNLSQSQSQSLQHDNLQALQDEINELKGQNIEISHKLTGENQKLSTELSKLQYQQSHDREDLVAYRRKNEANESKISAYNASFIELAEKLKQLNDDTKALRRDNTKKEKKCQRLEKSKKKLKSEIKDLNEKIENIRIVTKDLVRIKHESKLQSEDWEKERMKYENDVQGVKAEMMQQARKKIDSINKYNVEMNNLRTNIKTLQKRVVSSELENDRLRETDSQSVIGSAANWVPSVFWTTKK